MRVIVELHVQGRIRIFFKFKIASVIDIHDRTVYFHLRVPLGCLMIHHQIKRLSTDNRLILISFVRQHLTVELSTFLALILHFYVPVWRFFSEILSITHKGHVAFAVVILIVGVREVVQEDFSSPYATNCHRLLYVVEVGCRTGIRFAAF